MGSRIDCIRWIWRSFPNLLCSFRGSERWREMDRWTNGHLILLLCVGDASANLRKRSIKNCSLSARGFQGRRLRRWSFVLLCYMLGSFLLCLLLYCGGVTSKLFCQWILKRALKSDYNLRDMSQLPGRSCDVRTLSRGTADERNPSTSRVRAAFWSQRFHGRRHRSRSGPACGNRNQG